MIKFALWLIRLLWTLKKDDRDSLKASVTRWLNWQEDWDRKANKVGVKNIHDGILNQLPMGAGYVLLVSQSQAKDWRSVDVEITFTSNLSKREAVEVLRRTQQTLLIDTNGTNV